MSKPTQLAEIAVLAAAVEAQDMESAKARARLRAVIEKTIEAGVAMNQIAAAAGLSRQRVGQLRDEFERQRAAEKARDKARSRKAAGVSRV